MIFERGNRAIRDHLYDGKDLLVFQTRGREGVRFLGQFDCAGYTLERAPDREGQQRTAIVFSLIRRTVMNFEKTWASFRPGPTSISLASCGSERWRLLGQHHRSLEQRPVGCCIGDQRPCGDMF
jgi:hypothetical protein